MPRAIFPSRGGPISDTFVVHKLLILRGYQVIDVLKTQSFTVVRREPNMEAAMLDGVLTGNIQPEGLQVGDILDFAISMTSRDPTLKGHAQQVLDKALVLCDDDLSQEPDDAATLDSRGFVKLRLECYDDAIADYNAVLAKQPTMAPSLYGRAIAYARKGDAAKSKADAEAALKADPGIKDTFAGYGVTL